jgi:hypothetical protein
MMGGLKEHGPEVGIGSTTPIPPTSATTHWREHGVPEDPTLSVKNGNVNGGLHLALIEKTPGPKVFELLGGWCTARRLVPFPHEALMLAAKRIARAFRLAATGVKIGSPAELPETLKQHGALRHQLHGVLFEGPMTWK